MCTLIDFLIRKGLVLHSCERLVDMMALPDLMISWGKLVSVVSVLSLLF